MHNNDSTLELQKSHKSFFGIELFLNVYKYYVMIYGYLKFLFKNRYAKCSQIIKSSAINTFGHIVFADLS